MISFECPYLSGVVELTDERRRHIAERHPEMMMKLEEMLTLTLAAPDQVRRSERFANARLFSRLYNDLGGKHTVVVVVSDTSAVHRHWIVTAYLCRNLSPGDIEWARS